MFNRLQDEARRLFLHQPPADTFKPHPSWTKINQEKRLERERLEKHDQNGNTPLIQAIIANDFGKAKYLLDEGADIEGRGNNGFTPLAVAAYFGAYAIAKELIDRGAKLDRHTGGNPAFRPLTVAMRFSRSEEIVRLLILSGADVHAPDGSGCTPLTTAAACKQHGMVGMLLQSGVDASVADNNGNTADMYAAHRNALDIVELLQFDARTVAHMDFSLPRERNLLLANLPVEQQQVASPMLVDDELQRRKDRFFEDYIDPVTLEIIKTPHVSKYGFLYDRATIERLFAAGVTSVREPASNDTNQLIDRSELERKPCVILLNILREREAAWQALLARETQPAKEIPIPDQEAVVVEENQIEAMDISPVSMREESSVSELDEIEDPEPKLNDSQLRAKRRLFFEKGADEGNQAKRKAVEPGVVRKLNKG